MEIDVFCPHHLKDEHWVLPDSYRYFEGNVDCQPGDGETPHTIEAWFIRGMLVDVDRSRERGFGATQD